MVTTAKKNIPALRFPGFKGEWEEKKLGDITNKINSGKTPLGGEKVYQTDGILFIRSQNVNDNRLDLSNATFISDEVNATMQNSIVKANDILLNITGASLGRSCVVPNNFTIGNVNQHVCIIRLNSNFDSHFLQPIFASDKGQKLFESLQTGSGREGLNFDSLKKITLLFPSYNEQQKIASFLSSVDERLQQLQQQQSLLEQYKKGSMQQLFSQKLRFKDSNRKVYPDWKEAKIEDVFVGLKGSGLSKEKVIANGLFPCILYGELYTTYNEFINNVVSRTSSSEGIRSIKGDLLIPASTTTTGIDLAKAVALNQSNVLLGGDITILRSTKKINSIFYAYYLSNFKKKEIASFAQGITIVHLSFSNFKHITIDIPSIEEQTKIANFLSAIDEQINTVKQQIAQTQQFKKGLLQQMFV